MEKTTFHYSPSIPGSISGLNAEWDSYFVEDVKLSSPEVEGLSIAAMKVPATRIAVISEENEEYAILNFNSSKTLKLYGIASGKNTRMNTRARLQPGRYTKLRIYVDGNISYWSARREAGKIYDRSYIDFEFEDALEVWISDPHDFNFKFNFVPFQHKSLADYLGLKKILQRPRAKWSV